MQLRGAVVGCRPSTPLAAAMTLAVVLGLAPGRARADCVGDCDMSGTVTVTDVTVMVNIVLETAQVTSCPIGDGNADARITINDIIIAVNNALADCPSAATPTSTSTATLGEAPTATPTPSPTQNGVVAVADAVARDADGIAVHLGQTLSTEGVVTVAAGIFANNKLKVFVQDGGAGIMVYHQTSAAVDAYQMGQRLRATGVIRQQDPTSDSNPAIGTVLVDITQGTVAVLDDGNPIPSAQTVSLATLEATGTAYTGTIVRAAGVQKVGGDWPTVGSRSTQVDISDDAGSTTAVLRFQRNTITQELVQKLTAIGDGPFIVSGIVVQDDATDDGKLLSDFEIWVRGADDIEG
jgi:hypothetical protein